MGQRHQIFVKIANPVKHLRLEPKEKKELIKEFGTGEFAILAYHHQWLYGRSALHTALGLLQFGKQFTKDVKTNEKGYDGYDGYDCPFSPKGMGRNFGTKDKIVNAIQFILNFRPKETTALNAGFGSAWYIGKEDEGINFDYTVGDNNDGITIIDLVENKYCFMNIYEQDKEATHGIYTLPELKPVAAKDYVAAYYGETIATTNPYYFGDHDRSKITMPIDKQQKYVDKQIKLNRKAAKGFDKFEVLTKREIDAMFKRMKEKKFIETITAQAVVKEPKTRKKIKLF